MLKNDFEATHSSAEMMEVCNGICNEIEILFNSVVSAVVDYFEEE